MQYYILCVARCVASIAPVIPVVRFLIVWLVLPMYNGQPAIRQQQQLPSSYNQAMHQQYRYSSQQPQQQPQQKMGHSYCNHMSADPISKYFSSASSHLTSSALQTAAHLQHQVGSSPTAAAAATASHLGNHHQSVNKRPLPLPPKELHMAPHNASLHDKPSSSGAVSIPLATRAEELKEQIRREYETIENSYMPQYNHT